MKLSEVGYCDSIKQPNLRTGVQNAHAEIPTFDSDI